MKRIQTTMGAAMLAMASFGAEAQSVEPRLVMDSGFYLGAGGGRARGDLGCVTACDGKDTTWQGYAGYQFNRFVALEAGYSDFGTIESSGTLFGLPGTHRVDTTAWEVSMLGLAPFTPKFGAFLRLGMFHYRSDTVSSGVVVGTSSARGTEFTVGVGAQYAFTDHLGLRLEWQRYNDVSSGAAGVENDDLSVWRLSGRFKF